MKKEKEFKPIFLNIPYILCEDSFLRPSDAILYGVIRYFEKMKL